MRYKILHNRVDSHEQGAVVTEEQLVPTGPDGKPVIDTGKAIERLVDLGAIRKLTADEESGEVDAVSSAEVIPDLQNVDNATDAPDTPVALHKMNIAQLREKAAELGLPPEQIAALNRADLIAAVKQTQAQASVPPA